MKQTPTKKTVKKTNIFYDWLLQLWKSYQKNGVTDTLSTTEIRYVKALNGMVIIVTGLLWVQLPLVIKLLPDTQYILASFFFFPILWQLIPFLNRRGRYTEARLLFSLSTLILIVFDAVQLGPATENHLFMITIFLGGFIIYPPKERRLLWMVVVISAIMLIGLEWFFLQYGGLVDFPTEFVNITRWSSLSALFLIILGITAYHYDIVTEAEQKLEKEYRRSENLLLNILPYETALELKETGKAEARYFDEVSVLFTDFKGFTQLSEQLSPKELVEELNACFSSFDKICEKYGIEKIKTIGDAYLAVAGLPNPNEQHAEKAVKAAVEICRFMVKRKAQLGNKTFEIRIGIHSGSVVAGIVGTKKFAYDIWGDTVNTAARMESSGEPGKINVSESTYLLIKNKFECEYRGEIEAKGKGMMKMYFVHDTAKSQE